MKKLIYILVALILTSSLAACGNVPTKNSTVQLKEQELPKEISITEVKEYLADNYGKVHIDGSTSMIPLHQSLNNTFGSNKEAVEHSKTVDAFEKLVSGENDILLGVDYSDELLENAKSSGIKLIKKEITREAFVFLINKNNPVKSLTVDQIKDIYSGKITNWNEVGGDDAPIKAGQRNPDSGSQIRMTKFMGDKKLMEKDVEYYSTMGYVVEQIGDYNEGKYAIAYNMYTFTEKQYANAEVELLKVNDVAPTDETIFDQTYPITIYNYIYYDENNATASEFANNLHFYLMSDEGQKLISDSGYVNLNKKFDINKNIDKPYENDTEANLGFYNEAKGEFYDVDANGKLLVFNNYVDYTLHDTKYMSNAKARDYLTLISNSDLVKNPRTASLYEEKGTISCDPWFDASLDAEDFFDFKYKDRYYSSLTYFIDEDKYVLATEEKDTFDNYIANGYLDEFSNYTEHYVPDATLEITKEDLKNLYLRTLESGNKTQAGVELEYFQPFKEK